jgi:predicted transcriptional regulator
MRTIIDIPDEVLQVYDRVAKLKNLSRAEVIRQALEKDLAAQRDALLQIGFGAWEANPVDGVAWQRSMRDGDWT